MTVSRVLRGAPGASAQTRQRVLDLAQSLGYRPDPDLAQAMNLVRSKKNKQSSPTLAIIRESLGQDPIKAPRFHFVATSFLKKSASDYGYNVEEFWLGKDGLTPQRLCKILWSRGIQGIIVSPQSLSMPCQYLDYSKFSAAVLGYALKHPSLHRSTTNVVPGMDRMMEELLQRGHQRIGLAVTKWIDDRTQNIFSSGVLKHHFTKSSQHSKPPLYFFPHDDYEQDREDFFHWFHDYQPDVLISFEHLVPQWLKEEGLRIPKDLGYVLLDWTPDAKDFAGIDHRREHIAHGAVDLVAMQLMRHERGIPEVPRQISIPPRWVDGKSLRELR